MTRKHFVALAAALRETRPSELEREALREWASVVRALADTRAAQSRGSYGGFKAERFFRAAGMEV